VVTYQSPNKLLQLVPTSWPPDAFDKVRQRFGLLDQGLARSREEDA
jgi:hypothetical protein